MHPPQAARRRLVSVLLTLGVVAATMTAVAGAPATAAAAATVTADFGANNGTGRAEVFGSGINLFDDPARVDTLYQSGSRIIRRDIYLSEVLPNTTVENYKNNVNGVADPANWDWSKYAWIDEYDRRGFKLLIIMAYNTSWLGYSCGCAYHSPPRDWAVYEDIVRKIYQRYQSKIDMIEIWNEPNLGGFLNLTGSPYASLPGTGEDRSKAAYRDIYYHAQNAIRSVNATVPIGGPVVSNPDYHSWATALLNDGRIPRSSINFFSFHHYYDHFPASTVTTWKNVAAAAGLGSDFPVYVTEWNYSAAYTKVPLNNDSPDAISFAGNMLTSYYKQRANGTTFFADNDDNAPTIEDFIGMYANGTLTPKSRTYRLLSMDLGLGSGNSTIRGISYGSPVTNGGAATTATGENVAWVVNDGGAPIDVTMNLTGLGAITSTNANIFEAGRNQSVPSPKATRALTVSGGNATVRFTAPPKSVLGVRLAPYQIADTANLAPAATVTASSVYPQAGYEAANVKDGIVGFGDAGEWASNGQVTPWVQLTWPSARTVGRVVLSERPNPFERINAGRLIFSDGTQVPVPALPDDGTQKSILFTPRSVTSVRFEVTSASGPNVGLSEFQVYRGANIAPEATVTSSSQVDAWASGHIRAVDGITGNAGGEWAATETNPWLRLDWLNSRTISEVLLYDRAGANNANGGTLSFSDGTSIAVTGIPADSTAKSVTFAPKTVKWVRFQASGGSGSNVGLAEIQVMQAPNLASSAVATASSTDPAFPELNPYAATDGIINQWAWGEWASNRQTTPWLQLTWPSPYSVNQVVLYDRNNLTDRINAGILRFSDNSTVSVSGLDDSGLGKVVTFPPRAVTWVRFEVTNGAGWDVGLSEIEVFGSTQSSINWNMSTLGQIYDPAGQIYAYAPAALEANGTEHYWTCHNSVSGQIKDDIWHTKRSGGVITSDRSVLTRSASGWDSFHICDPAVVAATVNYQGTTYNYAMFYLGNDVDASAHNAVGVAFATTLDGPWVKYPHPIVAFPGSDPSTWGAGQPAVTAVQPELGKLLLFYTVGDTTTRAYRRELTLGNMASPVIGPAVQITTAGLTGSNGAPDHLNNFDIAYDPPTDRFYVVREQHPYPTDNPTYIGASLQIASIPGPDIWNGTGTWRVEGVISPALTGLPRNHNAGLMRTLYGTLPTSGTVSVVFTESCAGACDSLWTYDLWRITGTIVNP